MSARILRLPVPKKRGAKVRFDGCTQILQFPGSYPDHWNSFHQYIYRHLLRDGWSTKEATAKIECDIEDMIEAASLSSERDRMLFLAGRALSRARPLDR